jgi:xanthine/CO dehydrogenase XdhC/CoxF family maturation factor
VQPRANKFNLYDTLKQTIEEERPVALTTVITNNTEKPVNPGSKMLVFQSGDVEGSHGDSELDEKVINDAVALLKKEKSRTITYEFSPSTKIEVYIESVLPLTPLVIFGGDQDALPIVSFGKQLGFKVVLVDHRENFANPEKYPQADQTVVARPNEISQKVRLDEKTFVLIKTHNYLQDKEILETVLKSKARYVGQLGPKARTEDLLKDLSKEGVSFKPKELQRLYAPVGLDIGAESPEQIALSILGEMLAVKNGREGGFLKHQTLAIHPRD